MDLPMLDLKLIDVYAKKFSQKIYWRNDIDYDDIYSALAETFVLASSKKPERAARKTYLIAAFKNAFYDLIQRRYELSLDEIMDSGIGLSDGECWTEKIDAMIDFEKELSGLSERDSAICKEAVMPSIETAEGVVKYSQAKSGNSLNSARAYAEAIARKMNMTPEAVSHMSMAEYRKARADGRI